MFNDHNAKIGKKLPPDEVDRLLASPSAPKTTCLGLGGHEPLPCDLNIQASISHLTVERAYSLSATRSTKRSTNTTVQLDQMGVSSAAYTANPAAN